jgi:hypothetical protein
LFQSKQVKTKTDWPANGVSSGVVSKQHFLVKVQVPINVVTEKKRPKNWEPAEKKKNGDEKITKGPLVVYNKVSSNE